MTNETKGRYAAKRLIHISKEQEERMAAQSAQKIQAFAAEAAQVQGRRCELMGALLVAHVQDSGVPGSTHDMEIVVERCRNLAHIAVDADSRQKWTDLKALFLELGVEGPQPHLEWAAKQVGVTLFDEPAEEPLVQLATVEGVEKVIQ